MLQFPHQLWNIDHSVEANGPIMNQTRQVGKRTDEIHPMFNESFHIQMN